MTVEVQRYILTKIPIATIEITPPLIFLSDIDDAASLMYEALIKQAD
jgi:hypothetical protein